MRAIRIAAFVFAALLVCLLISRVLTVDPARPQNNTILDEAAGAQPTVPPPPDLPEPKTVEQPGKRVRHARSGDAGIPPAPPPLSRPPQTIAADPRPVIREVDDPPVEAGNAPATPADAATEAASIEEPKGPVIVVPHERPKEDSRGVRWLKAMGHALGIRRAKDPADQAFR